MTLAVFNKYHKVFELQPHGGVQPFMCYVFISALRSGRPPLGLYESLVRNLFPLLVGPICGRR